MADLKELGTLIVVIGKARNLPNKSRFGKQDPFCTVHVGEEKQRTKAIKRGGQHPEWDEELRFKINEDIDDLLVRSESQNQFDSLSSVSKHTSLSSNMNPSQPTPPPKDHSPGISAAGTPNASLSGSVTAQALANKSRKGPIGKKGGKSMKVACFADDAKEPELIGEVTVPIDEVLKLGEVDEWYEFSFKDKYSGEVYLELTFYSNDAPPVKRNVPRPSVHPYDLMPSSSTSSLSGRPGGLAASGSVSGMNLYIPPYVQAERVSSGPPPGSGGFADLGLPSGHRHSLASSIASSSMDALTRPMSGLSINTPPAQQTPPRAPAIPPQGQGHGYGHRHSVGGPADAPWSQDLPQHQPAHQLALLRPGSAAQPSSSYSDPRRGTPNPLPVPFPGHDPRATTPVPNSLQAGRVPIEPRPHAQSFSGPSRPMVPPQASYLHPTPTPPPHPNSAPPVQLQPHYQVPVSSYAPPGHGQGQGQQGYDPRSNNPYPQGQDGRQGGLPQPPPSRSNSLPVRQPSPQPLPPNVQGQDQYYPDRSYTPRPSYPGPGQSPLPPQHTQTPPHGYPPQSDHRQSYPGSQQDAGYQNQGQNGYQHPPPQDPAREPTPNNQGYIPWYQQTQPSQPPPPPPASAPPQAQYDPYSYQQQSQPYSTPAPPPVPSHRPQSVQPPAPPPPRSSVGYYPSDELYVQQQHETPRSSTPQAPWQPPQPPRGSTPQPPWQQPPLPPPRGSTPQPTWQQQQQQQQQQRPVSPQPPIPGQWHQSQDPYGYQGQQPAPQYDQNQRYNPPPAPSQSYTPSYTQQQPTSSYPQQAQSYPAQAPYQPLAPSPPPAPPGWQSSIPQQQQQPPRGPSPSSNGYAQAPPPPRAPSPLPTQMGQDWRSYLQSLPTPGRSPSPAPPSVQQQQQHQYAPPPSLPSSLKPPDGWQSHVPTSNDGHQWNR